MKPYIPFTYPWFFRRHLKADKRVLDVGCGNGGFMLEIGKNKKLKATGVDLFGPYVNSARKTKAYKKVIKKDIRKIDFPEKSFDIVICSQVVEHLEKDEASKLIRRMEKIAKETVIIGTPNGHFHQDAYDENPLQEHHSSWTVNDFQSLGYEVHGQATKFIYGENGLLSRGFIKFFAFKYALFLVSYILSPVSYLIPRLGAHLVAVKRIKT